MTLCPVSPSSASVGWGGALTGVMIPTQTEAAIKSGVRKVECKRQKRAGAREGREVVTLTRPYSMHRQWGTGFREGGYGSTPCCPYPASIQHSSRIHSLRAVDGEGQLVGDRGDRALVEDLAAVVGAQTFRNTLCF